MVVRFDCLFFLFFFFSSRRRHTRWTGDWSSDVCSSDLKLQRSLDCLEARLVTQWIKQWVRLESLQAGCTQPRGCFEPLQSLPAVSPLRIDRGVYGWTTVTPNSLQVCESGFCVGIPCLLVVYHRQTLLNQIVLANHGFAGSASGLQVPEQILSDSEFCAECGSWLQSETIAKRHDRLVITSKRAQPLAKEHMRVIVQRIQGRGAPEHRESVVAPAHEDGENAVIAQYSGVRGRQGKRTLILFTGAHEFER